MRNLIFLLSIIIFSSSAYSEQISLTEKEALCLGFKWEAARQMGIQLFPPKVIDGFSADVYVAEYEVLDETVFIINAPINLSKPHRGIKVGALDSGQSGGVINIYVHYVSPNGSKKRIYKFPPVSQLLHYDFERC
jgi:hypothetical protein